MKVHQIKIDFNVTGQIKRFVYVYILEAESLYLIDSGVYGSEIKIIDFLDTIGRSISEIRGIFLTHAHPDHIGSDWIEDIDLQFSERPIPNFYNLAGKSSKVDVVVKDGDEIQLDGGVVIKVIRTAGHSCDELSYLVGDCLFIGDSVPVKGDIPIFIDEQEIRKTLNILGTMEGVETFYPAWDQTYDGKMMKRRLADAAELIDMLKNTVLELDDGTDVEILTSRVCDRLNMQMLKANPLFCKTIACLR